MFTINPLCLKTGTLQVNVSIRYWYLHIRMWQREKDKPLESPQEHHTFPMQMCANTCTTRHWPQLARHRSSKYQNFPVFNHLLPCHLPDFFLINMQMQAIRFACWIELISATPSACTVITNYRQASDGRLKPWILSERLLPRGRNPNQHNWSDGEILLQHSNLAYPLSVPRGYSFPFSLFPISQLLWCLCRISKPVSWQDNQWATGSNLPLRMVNG